MTDDRTEQLVREAFDAEADRAVDSREILANLRRARPPRRGYVLAAAVVAVVVVATAVVMPTVFRKSAPPAADQPLAAQSVLIVGVDTGGFTDSIVLARIVDGSVNLVSLPRDTRVQVPGGGTARLNKVYSAHGIDTLLATVGDLTGVTIDHYAVVDMTAVGALATAVSGVPVCLNAPSKDEAAGTELPAGEQSLEGDDALGFLRQRRELPNSDFDRIVRHQVFLTSLAAKLRDVDLPSVIGALEGRITTDKDLDPLALATAVVEAKELRVGTIPLNGEDDENRLTVDPAKVRQFVEGQESTPPVSDDVPCVN